MSSVALNGRNGISVGFPLVQVIDALGNFSGTSLTISGTSSLGALSVTSLTVSGTTSFGSGVTGTTSAQNTNSTVLATTAFVVGQKGNTAPGMNGTASAGVSLLYASQDHIHPTDTSKLNSTNPSITGSLGIVGGTVTTNTPVLLSTQTWNGTGITFDGIRLDITNTASVNSLLMNLRVWNATTSVFDSKFSVSAVGVVNVGIWNATVITPSYGGTGVANTGTITLGGNFATSGAFATTLTSTAATNVTLPTTGTLSTLAGVETFSNKTFSGNTYIGTVRLSDNGGAFYVFSGITTNGNIAIPSVSAITIGANTVLSNGALGTSILSSSLTSVGTLTGGTWNSTVISGQYGGTGIANTGKTLTLGGNFVTSGAFATTLTSTAATNVTLPTTGTLATLAGIETLSNKTLDATNTVPTATLGTNTTQIASTAFVLANSSTGVPAARSSIVTGYAQTGDAYSGTLKLDASTLVDSVIAYLPITTSNTTTAPTFTYFISFNGITYSGTGTGIATNTIYKYNDKNAVIALQAGDLYGTAIIKYDLANTRWILLNPLHVGSPEPAFSATNTISQLLPVNTDTKISFNLKAYDRTSEYDNVTNYRFLPSVAGYYQVHFNLDVATSTSMILNLFKNGAAFIGISPAPTTNILSIDRVIYLNGTTDYIEAYGKIGVSQYVGMTSSFQATLIQRA